MERREGMRAREKGVFMMRRGSQEAHCWRTAGGGGRTPAAAQWMQEHMYQHMYQRVSRRAPVWYTLLAGYSQVQMWVQALM